MPKNKSSLYSTLTTSFKKDAVSLSDKTLSDARKEFPALSDTEIRIQAARRFVKLFYLKVMPYNFAINAATFAPPPINALVNVAGFGVNIYYMEKNFRALGEGIYRILGREYPKKDNFIKKSISDRMADEPLRRIVARTAFVSAKKMLLGSRRKAVSKLAKTSVTFTSRQAIQKKMLGFIPAGVGACAVVAFDTYHLHKFGEELIKEITSKK